MASESGTGEKDGRGVCTGPRTGGIKSKKHFFQEKTPFQNNFFKIKSPYGGNHD